MVGIKNVTVSEPWCQGHFPGMPVMPGVLLVEAMAQVGGVLLLHELGAGGKVPFLMSVDKVKFRRPVRPGDQLRITINVLRLRSSMSACHATVTVDGQPVAEAEIRSVMMERPA
jgi:beta-hydroxyacyl-ACP dehydratase FabZ